MPNTHQSITSLHFRLFQAIYSPVDGYLSSACVCCVYGASSIVYLKMIVYVIVGVRKMMLPVEPSSLLMWPHRASRSAIEPDSLINRCLHGLKWSTSNGPVNRVQLIVPIASSDTRFGHIHLCNQVVWHCALSASYCCGRFIVISLGTIDINVGSVFIRSDEEILQF